MNDKWRMVVAVIFMILIVVSIFTDCRFTKTKHEYTETMQEQNLLLQKQNTLLLEMVGEEQND